MKDVVSLDGKVYESGHLVRLRYGIGPMTLWRWTQKGLLPRPIKLGGRVFYPRDEVTDIEARLVDGQAE